MPRRLLTLYGLAAWILLFAAVLNFAPAQFTNRSLDATASWEKVIKDVPVVLLALALLLMRRPREWAGLLRAALQRSTVRWVLRPFGRDPTRAELLGALLIAVAGFAGYMVISVLMVQTPALGTLVSARYYVVYPALAILVALGPLPRLRPLAIAVVALACLQTVFAALDFMGAFGYTYYFGEVQLVGYLFPRAIGTLGNPNNLGIYLALAVIVIVSAGEHRARRGQLALGINAIGLALTFSKSALIALGVVMLGPLAATSRRHRRWLSGLVVFVALGALVTIVVGSRPGSTGLFGSRGQTAENALREWVDSPMSFLLGDGFASQTSVADDGMFQETVIDNMVLAVGVQGGLVGLAMFSLIIVLGMRLVLLAGSLPGLSLVARRYAVFFLLYTPLAVNFRLFPGALFFWILAGLNAASTATRDAEVDPHSQDEETSRATQRIASA